MLPCQSVVRPARVGATPALFCDTPWPSRESQYLHRGHSLCRFATVSPGGLTVEIRFVPEELRWCPEISRCCFTAQCLPVRPGGFKCFETTGAISRWMPVQHDLSRFNAVLARVATVAGTVATPGLKSGTVWTRLWYSYSNIAHTMSFPQCWD